MWLKQTEDVMIIILMRENSDFWWHQMIKEVMIVIFRWLRRWLLQLQLQSLGEISLQSRCPASPGDLYDDHDNNDDHDEDDDHDDNDHDHSYHDDNGLWFSF